MKPQPTRLGVDWFNVTQEQLREAIFSTLLSLEAEPPVTPTGRAVGACFPFAVDQVLTLPPAQLHQLFLAQLCKMEQWQVAAALAYALSLVPAPAGQSRSDNPDAS